MDDWARAELSVSSHVNQAQLLQNTRRAHGSSRAQVSPIGGLPKGDRLAPWCTDDRLAPWYSGSCGGWPIVSQPGESTGGPPPVEEISCNQQSDPVRSAGSCPNNFDSSNFEGCDTGGYASSGRPESNFQFVSRGSGAGGYASSDLPRISKLFAVSRQVDLAPWSRVRPRGAPPSRCPWARVAETEHASHAQVATQQKPRPSSGTSGIEQRETEAEPPKRARKGDLFHWS